MEPLLGPVVLNRYLRPRRETVFPVSAFGMARTRDWPAVNWVIVGGESGPHARPMQSQWVRDLRDQCRQAGTAFFFKQWGQHWPVPHNTPTANPRAFFQDGQWFVPMGKSAAGRELDGEIWNQFPPLT